MSRGLPSLCFDSIEPLIGVEDQYVSSWIENLEKNFNIFFCNHSIFSSHAHRIGMFRKKRLFADIEKQNKVVAAFCFNRGILCNEKTSSHIRAKGIKTLGVIYGNEIHADMSNAISMGLFDELILSKCSSLKDRALELNPFQKVSSIRDSFPCTLKESKNGIGIIVPGRINDSVIVAQINLIRAKFDEVSLVDASKNFCYNFKNGVVLMPQHAFREDLVKKAQSIYCSGVNVFVPKETKKLFSFGLPYGDILEIKDMSINSYLDKTECFDPYDFNSSIISIINRS
jgi:hypothetical protein